MPRKNPDPDFEILVDPSCLSAPMDDETATKENANVESPAPEIPEDENAEQEPDAEEEPAIEETIMEEELYTEEPTIDETIMEDPHDEDGSWLEEQEEPDNPTKEEDESMVDEEQEVTYSDGEDEDTPGPTQVVDNDVDGGTASRRQSDTSQVRASLRTEALIQATAREVVAKIEADARARASGRYLEEHDGHEEYEQHDDSINSTTHDSCGIDGTEMTYEDQSDTSRRESCRSSGSQIHHHVATHSVSGESSSHPEADDEDDVFSDHSPRSSLGSMDGGHDAAFKLPSENETPSPRIPRVSDISGISQYDKEEFVPTSRDTPRVPFRTPSAVRAIQMSSPTPSVYSRAIPRSSNRHTGFATISRLGSPTASAQYSPKGRSTPTRFKPKEAPLVLLHVTLMPLRWMWGDVLNGLDAVYSNGGDEAGGKRFEPSDELKTLRGAWRQLQDRTGDTVLERGILLPHPQNDYEVLEERLLEALDLPLRRRARILECGHYLGPANEHDDGESDDDYDAHGSLRDRSAAKRHWCATCRGDIRYEDLGPGKMFRVKVYASNGLMKAGAWDACWKEMERVDVELEPVVEMALHAELERLSTIQSEVEEERQRELDREEEERQLAEEQGEFLPPVRQSTELYRADHSGRIRSPTAASSPPHVPTSMRIAMHASPPEPNLTSSPLRVLSPPAAVAAHAASSIDASEERRYRDEERLREIYGHTPPRTHPEVDETPSSHHHDGAEHASTRRDPPHPDSYIAPPSPRSPSEEAFDRRSGRRADDHGTEQQHQHQQRGTYQTASLQELLLETARVLLRDRRNVAIALLSFFVLMLAVRPAQLPLSPPLQPLDTAVGHEHAYSSYRPATELVATTGAAAATVAVDADDRGVEGLMAEMVAGDNPSESPVDHQRSGVSALEESAMVMEESAVRVRETITETVRVSVTVSEPESVETEAELEPEALHPTAYETQTETDEVAVSASTAAGPMAVESEAPLVADVADSAATGPEELETEAQPVVEAEVEAVFAPLKVTGSAPVKPTESTASDGVEADTAIPAAGEVI